MEITIISEGKERVVKFKDITMELQENFIEAAEKFESESKPLEMMRYTRNSLIEYTDLTLEEYKKLEVKEGNKLISAFMKLMRPFQGNEDF